MNVQTIILALSCSVPADLPTVEQVELQVRESYSRYHSFSLRYDCRLLRSEAHPDSPINNPDVKDDDLIGTKQDSVILDWFGNLLNYEVQSVIVTKGGKTSQTRYRMRWSPQRRVAVRFDSKTVVIDEAKKDYLPSQTPVHAAGLELDFTDGVSLPDLFGCPQFLRVDGFESIDGHETVLLVYEPTDAVRASLLPERRMAFWLSPDQNWLPRRIVRYKHNRDDPTAQYDNVEFFQAKDLATGGTLPFPRKIVHTSKYMDFEWVVNSAEINLPQRRFPDESAVIPAGFVVENRLEPNPSRAVSGGARGIQQRIDDSTQRARNILKTAEKREMNTNYSFLWPWIALVAFVCLLGLLICLFLNWQRARSS